MTYRHRLSFRVVENQRHPADPCVGCWVAAAGIVSAVLGVSLLAAWAAWWVRP
jgi:hypothetical protein